MAMNTDADVCSLLVSERLPHGNSLVPLEPLDLHASHYFLFFAACVQRSLLAFFH